MNKTLVPIDIPDDALGGIDWVNVENIKYAYNMIATLNNTLEPIQFYTALMTFIDAYAERADDQCRFNLTVGLISATTGADPEDVMKRMEEMME